MRDIVLSLYDYTGLAVQPWADSGYTCFCFDKKHGVRQRNDVHFIKADLWQRWSIDWLIAGIRNGPFRGRVAFVYAFPVCTDLAVSGSKHFASKLERDPLVQTRATKYARWCADVGDAAGCPYVIENPVSRLATLWRESDYRFDPCDYGGYLPENDAHPMYPEYIPPRDAYTKRTCLWTGGGFIMPPKRRVDPETPGESRQFRKLGGTSDKTKDIRSATPRGVVRAIFEAHHTR